MNIELCKEQHSCCWTGFPAVIGYNPTLQEWRRLPLTFANEEFKIRYLVTSGGGLLCFYGKAGRLSAAVMVCNPLTKAWKVLPPIPRKPVVIDVNLVKLLIPDEETKSYKIFLADLHEDCVVAQVYESLSNQWTTYSAPARYQLLAQGVFVNGSVHFMASKWVGDDNSCHMHKAGMSFDFENKTFSTFEAPLTGPTQMVEIHGCFYIVLIGSPTDGNNCATILIKRDESGEWADVTKIPAERRILIQASNCLGSGDFLYFTERNGTPVISYDLVQRTWMSIRATDQKCEKHGHTVYHPSFLPV